jgi:DNA-binding NarL/FixJ family response regulator
LTAGKKTLRDVISSRRITDRETHILFVESSDLEFLNYRKQMNRYGLWDVKHTNREKAEKEIKETFYNIIVIEVPNTLRNRESLSFLSRLRALGFRGIAVMTAESATPDLIYRCARLGASEFLLKNRSLDMGREISRLLGKRPSVDRTLWHPKMNLGLGLFTSAGLTQCEIEILEEFAKGFPKHSEIAKRLSKSEPYIRKNFSRIYNKLGEHISIENSAQLSHLLTICSLYT